MFGIVLPAEKNQDVIKVIENDFFYLGVLADGHGGEGKGNLCFNSEKTSFGRIAADFSVEKVCEKLIDKLQKEEKEIEQDMKLCFNEIHTELEQVFKDTLTQYEKEGHFFDKIDEIARGGTTLTTVLVPKTKEKRFIVCANVGDSEAFVFGKEKIHHLTKCHNPDSQEEYDRIRQLDSNKPLGQCVYHVQNEYRVDKMIKIFGGNGVKFPREEIIRYYGSKLSLSTVREDLSCYFAYQNPNFQIAVTRSIGDYFGHQIGMSFTPDTQIYYPTDEDEYVFIASDGVLDCYHFEELRDLVLKIKTDEELGEIFKQKAISLFGKRRDDISFIRFKL